MRSLKRLYLLSAVMENSREKVNVVEPLQTGVPVSPMVEVEPTTKLNETITSNHPNHSTSQRSKRGKGKGKMAKKAASKGAFKCTNSIREEHGKPLFGVAFSYHLPPNTAQMFATVGSNRVTIYECRESGYMKAVQAYVDSDTEETFYSCAWTVDTTTNHPLLAFAGARGVIRLLNVYTRDCVKHYISHGNAVNELKFHPTRPHILLSASKDHSLRVWNVKSDVLVCMFAGVEGHRDEVLSCDFDVTGTKIVSCGMDHSLKIWRFDSEELLVALKASDVYVGDSPEAFPTLHFHYPYFSTRDIHRNYVDCARWFGDYILSKSCENCIVCWKPGACTKDIDDLKPKETNLTVLSRLDFTHCDIWYMRFAIDFQHKYLAVGNLYGKTFLWDLRALHPHKSKYSTLSTVRCTTTIRQTAFSKDSSILICVCDDATIWRWDATNK